MSESGSANGPEYAEYMNIAATNRRVREDLLARANVVGVGVGDKQTSGEDTGVPCIVVMVSTKMPPEELADDDIVPSVVDGIPTDVVETGVFSTSEFDVRMRPAPGGISISPLKPGSVTGTLSTTCLDRDDARREGGIPRRYYILSCSHVLAAVNPQSGDAIIQPGLADGGGSGDVIADLWRWTPIQLIPVPPVGTIPVNFVDAAIGRMRTVERTSRLVHWIGYPRRRPPSGTAYPTPVPKMRLQKTGRTTEFSTGMITAIATWLVVQMPSLGGSAFFGDVIVATKMGESGDSGALVMEIDHNVAIGLLFAGSTSATLINPLSYVENSLRIRIAVDPA